MTLSSIAGVFSRYFIVGFFLPTFFALVALSQTVSAAFLPPVYEHASSGAEIAILGGVALAGGLLLLGVHHQVLRLYEGYPLSERANTRGVKWIYRAVIELQRHRFRSATKRCGDLSLSDEERFDSEWKLDRRFPRDVENPANESALLPTSFGNAVRAFERSSFLKWHLNSIGAWPHVENLLSSQEAQVLADARGDVAFFINSSLLGIASIVVLLIDIAEHSESPSPWVILVPVAVSSLAYWWAIGAAIRWGEVVRACVDLHRRELYAKLGLRTPRDFKDERVIAWSVNNTLLLDTHLPDDLAAQQPTSTPTAPTPGAA